MQTRSDLIQNHSTQTTEKPEEDFFKRNKFYGKLEKIKSYYGREQRAMNKFTIYHAVSQNFKKVKLEFYSIFYQLSYDTLEEVVCDRQVRLKPIFGFDRLVLFKYEISKI